jgi:integrase
MEQIEQQGKKENESLTLRDKSHRHKYFEEGSYLVCSCGKKILKLEHTDKEGLLMGKKDNNSKYSVRTDRRRYFFPDEWNLFIKQFTNKEHKFFFLTCLNTGGRIMEVLNLRYRDIDEDRGTVNFSIVKQRKAKKNFYATGKNRGFFLGSEFLKEYKSFIRNRTINKEDYIFLDNKKLPANYNELDNKDRMKYYKSKVVSYSNILKRKLKLAGIKDYYNFSPHNIRKTYGMWMRTYNIDMGELCYRMGHDMDTFIAHYGSSLIFTEEERRKIRNIMGDVK